jgi:hypothetical protein
VDNEFEIPKPSAAWTPPMAPIVASPAAPFSAAIAAPPEAPLAAPAFTNAAETLELVPQAPATSARRSRWGLVAGVASLALILGALGFVVANRNSGPRIVTIDQATARTRAQKSARIAMTMNMPIPGLGGGNVEATGEFSFETKLMRLNMDLSAAMASQLPDAEPKDFQVTVIANGLKMYERIPALDQEPRFAGKWIFIDYAALLGKTGGVDLAKVMDGQSNDPGAVLDQLQAAADTLEKVGPDTVRGVKTTHYKATMSLEKMYRAKGAVTDEAQFQKVLEQFSSTTTTADVWIDADNLVRRVTYVLPLKAKVSTINIEYYDFGVATNIEVPAEADTMDLSELTGAGGS